MAIELLPRDEIQEDKIDFTSSAQNLASSIIIEAAQNYFEYRRAVMRGGSKFGQSKKTMERLTQEVVDFFENKDGTFQMYVDWLCQGSNSNIEIDGRKIMQRIDLMIEDEEKYPDDFIRFNL